jgi:hypothetical protein
VPSSKGRRTAPAAKERQSSKSKKREAPSKDSPAQASKKKKTSATKGVDTGGKSSIRIFSFSYLFS